LNNTDIAIIFRDANNTIVLRSRVTYNLYSRQMSIERLFYWTQLVQRRRIFWLVISTKTISMFIANNDCIERIVYRYLGAHVKIHLIIFTGQWIVSAGIYRLFMRCDSDAGRASFSFRTFVYTFVIDPRECDFQTRVRVTDQWHRRVWLDYRGA
jgi:hypothetical protein